jgi:hypothetical protein
MISTRRNGLLDRQQIRSCTYQKQKNFRFCFLNIWILVVHELYKYQILCGSLKTLLQHRTNNDAKKNVKEKIWKANFEILKISHEDYCKLFLVMISMNYSKGYYKFLARNELNFNSSLKN